MITATIENYLNNQPDRIIIKEMNGKDRTLHQMNSDINNITSKLRSMVGDCKGKVFGVAMRSSYEWIYTMLAIHRVGGILLPVPIEFSDDQIESLMVKSTVVFVNNQSTKERIKKILPNKPCIISNELLDESVKVIEIETGELIGKDIVSIIHTSGTTSKPKGVKIRNEAVSLLVKNVMDRLPQGPLNYLSIVPMSLLIEQVLGIYIPILSGGTISLMPDNFVEYGSASGNAKDYLELIKDSSPNFLYLPPKLLEEANLLLDTAKIEEVFGYSKPHIVTGGAKISEKILKQLENKGVYVYEAYGLSENSSIISLNSPAQRKIGSVGQLLEGIEPKFVNGELLVKTPTLCAGYYSSDDTSCDLSDGYLHTGDIAEIRDNFLYITGRKKHVIILSTARNISPEWVEGIYKESPLIDDIIVMGEGMDEPCAVVLSKEHESLIKDEINQLNSKLADFARVDKITIINNIQSFRDRFYTITGRPRRKDIENTYMSSMYK